jgi:hypothetical protein
MSNGTAKLIGLGDPVKDKEIPCTGMVKIGRDEKTNSCPVKHASVSRQHAQIVNDAGTWTVEDLKSTNGVFVNEAKISGKTPLKNGDVVRVGDIPFKFEMFGEVGNTQVLKKSDAPAAAPAPKPAAVAPQPPPAPKPVPPTLPPKAKNDEGGGEDLFEPSIVGGADMGAAIRAAQAEGAKGAAVKPAAGKPAPPPPEEGEFEGTMYGPQVARQLVKAIREEKEHKAEEAAKGSGDPTKRSPSAGPKVPNMFVLKIKAIAFGVVMLAGIAAFLIWAMGGREEAQKAQAVMMEAKGKVDQFWEDYESRVLPADPLEQGRVLDQELQKLAEVQGAVKAAMNPLEKQPEYLAKVKKFDERVRFLIFERKFKQAILKQDKAEAERQLAELDTNGTTEQKMALALGKIMAKYQLFHVANQAEPKRAEQPPAQKEVDDLKQLQPQLESEYKDRSKDLLVLGKRFYNNAKEVIDNDLPAMLAWDRFWLEYKDYEAAKDADKAAKAEALKKAYPNMKIIQALK